MFNWQKWKVWFAGVLKAGVRLVWEHRYTVGYATLGYVVGHVIDSILTISIPFYGTIRLTGGMIAVLLSVSGGICGFLRDMENAMTRTVIVRESFS